MIDCHSRRSAGAPGGVLAGADPTTPDGRILVRSVLPGADHAQGLQDVVDGFDEGGAVADQVVAAVGERVVDGTGHGHHLAAQLGRLPCGDQRAAAQGGFHHQGAA